MTSSLGKKKQKEKAQPDGSLGVFYMETPCPNTPYYDYSRSETFMKLREDEKNLKLAKKYPTNPWVTAEVEVKGVQGQKILEEAHVVTSTDDGDIELPEEEEEFCKYIFKTLVERYGPDAVRLHPKSLAFKEMPEYVDRYEQQQEERAGQLRAGR